jgi:hypothetical protein
MSVALTIGLLTCLPQTASAQISGSYSYDGGRQAYFITGNTTVFGDISVHDVLVGKDNGTGFNTIPSGITLNITDGANISGSNVSDLYPDGKYYYGLNTFGANRVEMSGGSMETANGYNTSVFDISGGSVSDLSAYNNSTINLSGGSITNAYGEDSGIVNITGGSVFRVIGDSSSTIRISGGSINQIFGTFNSTVHITGGTIGGGPVRLLFDCIVTLTGTELSVSNGVAGSDLYGSYTAYTLSGTLQGGQSVNGISLHDYDGGLSVGDPYSGSGNLRFFASASPSATAPEPGTLALLIGGSSVLFMLRRRGVLPFFKG